MTIRVRLLLTVCLLVVATPRFGRAAVGVGDASPGAPATDRIIIRLRAPAEERVREWAWQRGLGHRRADVDPTATLSREFQNESRRWNASRMRPAYPQEFARPDLAAKYGLDRFYVLEVPPGSSVRAMAEAFARLSEDVELAGVDPPVSVAGGFIPNDPYFSLQTALRNTGQLVGGCGGSDLQPCDSNSDCPGTSCSGSSGTADADIDADEAWNLETSVGAGITIAIIDSGVDPHPDFGNRLLPGYNWDAPFTTPNLTTDGCPHGTHVAGIAASGGHNGVGGAGVAWGANILPVRVLNGCGGQMSALTNGIIWAADNGANVANFSLQFYENEGGVTPGLIANLQAAVDYAAEQGMVLIAATGNNRGPGLVALPASLRGVIAVGGTDARDRRAASANGIGWSSNNGPQIDVSAPGDDIFATWTNSGYRLFRGTSMATPNVSGVAALMKANRPELAVEDISDILTIAVEDKGAAGWDQDFGYGRINALKALEITATWPRIESTPGNRAIDARQPTDPLGFESYGWDSIEIMSAPEVVAGLTVETIAVEQRAYVCSGSRALCGSTNDCPDLQVCEPLSDDEPAPQVIDIIPIDAERATVVLDRKISLQAWTRIQPDDGSLIRLAYLPGDVNANQLTDSADIAALLTELPTDEDPEFQTSLPEWSVDLNRSGSFTSLDVLTWIDLYNGADAHAKWSGKKLEPGIE